HVDGLVELGAQRDQQGVDERPEVELLVEAEGGGEHSRSEEVWPVLDVLDGEAAVLECSERPVERALRDPGGAGKIFERRAASALAEKLDHCQRAVDAPDGRDAILHRHGLGPVRFRLTERYSTRSGAR